MLPFTSYRKVTSSTHECQALSCDDYDIMWTALTDGETQECVECETHATFSKWQGHCSCPLFQYSCRSFHKSDRSDIFANVTDICLCVNIMLS